MDTTTLPPMREWLFTRRLSSRFYALVLAGAGAAAAESLPACSLDSLVLEDSSLTTECVISGTQDTLFVWPDEERITWGYQRIGPEWVTEGVLSWGINRDARLVPLSISTRDQWFADPSGEDDY